jgi:hypothetical protein
VQASFRDLQFGCDVGVTETIETAKLHQALRDVQDPGVGVRSALIAAVASRLVLVCCHRVIISGLSS